jgi:hypothetical protein
MPTFTSKFSPLCKLGAHYRNMAIRDREAAMFREVQNFICVPLEQNKVPVDNGT